MKYPLFLAMFSALLFTACQNTQTPRDSQEKETASKEDSLYKAVIEFHDEAMPKMGKIIGYQKTVQARIDSLEHLAKAKGSRGIDSLEKKYDELLEQLKSAEKGMNDWMDSFEPDPKLPTQQELENYWEDQHKKAKKMRDDIMAAIEKARESLDH